MFACRHFECGEDCVLGMLRVLDGCRLPTRHLSSVCARDIVDSFMRDGCACKCKCVQREYIRIIMCTRGRERISGDISIQLMFGHAES
jgi:hypothetical protein